jgi:uncharacterized protein (TIGR03437 family)
MKQVFSMTLGGSGSTAASAVAVDGAGNVYVAGNTNSADFPLKNGLPVIPSAGDCTPHLSNFAPCSDAFVTKLSADGQTMVYSTRLGGSDADVATALAVDASGSAIIAGNTASADFPLANAFQSYPGDTGCLSNYQPYESSPCPHQFAARLAPDGSRLIYSTYLGRKDASIVAGVALDSSGNAIVTGTTMGHGLSATPFAWQHCNASQQIHSASIRGIRGMDGIEQRGTSGTIAQLRPDGTLAHATYFGGTGGYDQMLAVVASGVGVWIASMTASTDLPTAAAAIQTNAGLGYFAKVDFTAPATPPRIDPGCVLNSGNLIHDYLAPYEIVTIFGSNLGPSQGVGAQLNAQGRVATELAGTMVTFSGYPAPLLYVSAGQVNAIVPHLITGIPRARVEVTVNGVTSEARQELARLASPAFFSSDMSGTGQAIAVNEDGTVNSAGNPAVRGSVVAFWMTGAGLLNKPYEDGEIVTGDPGGLFFPLTSSLPVLYAGQAPGMVAGVVQINLRIGQDFPPWITSVAPSVTVANVGTYPVFVSIR